MTVISRLTDPRSLEYGITSSAALGSLSLIDPNRLSGGRRVAYRLLVAASTAAVVALELRAQPENVDAGPVFTTAIPAAAAGLTLAVARPAERLDARLQRSLRQQGVRRPRALMAAGSAGMSLAAFLTDRYVNRWANRPTDPLRTP